MPEPIPTLSIERSVLNIVPEQIKSLKDGLSNSVADSVGARMWIQQLFRPVDSFHVPIIANSEFAGLQKALRSNRLEPDALDLLANCLETEFASLDSAGAMETNTLPLHLDWQTGPKYNLVIGGSPEIARERAVARRVIADFIGDELPTNIVDPDNDSKATRVMLARSKWPEQVALIHTLVQLIEEPTTDPEKKSLPETILLSPVNIRPSTKIWWNK